MASAEGVAGSQGTIVVYRVRLSCHTDQTGRVRVATGETTCDTISY